MKKLTALFIALILCLTVSGCGKAKFTVKDKEGKVSEMTMKELYAVKANQAQFDKLYNGAKISFTGTVQKVVTNNTINGSGPYDIIEFKEGITLYTNHNQNVMFAAVRNDGSIYDYSTINIGDKLIVEEASITTFPAGINASGFNSLKKAN